MQNISTLDSGQYNVYHLQVTHNNNNNNDNNNNNNNQQTIKLIELGKENKLEVVQFLMQRRN